MNYLAPNPSSFRPATSIIYTPSTPSEQHPMRLSTQINPPSSRLTNSILYTPSDSSRPLRITTPQGSRGPVDSLSDLSRSYNQSPMYVRRLTMRDASSLKRSFKLVKIGDGAHRLEFDPKTFAKLYRTLSENDILLLKRAFDKFDTSKTGILTPYDIKTVLMEAGFKPTKETIYEIIGEFDDDESGGVGFDEFLKIINKALTYNEKREDIDNVFHEYDKSGKGYIDFEDMRRMAALNDENMTDDDIQDILDRSSKGTGKITSEDFYNIMKIKITQRTKISTVIMIKPSILRLEVNELSTERKMLPEIKCDYPEYDPESDALPSNEKMKYLNEYLASQKKTFTEMKRKEVKEGGRRRMKEEEAIKKNMHNGLPKHRRFFQSKIHEQALFTPPLYPIAPPPPPQKTKQEFMNKPKETSLPWNYVKNTNSFFDENGLLITDENIIKSQNKRSQRIYLESLIPKFQDSEANKLHKNAKWVNFTQKYPFFGETVLNTWEYKFRGTKEKRVFFPNNFTGGFFDKTLKDYTH